MRRGRIDYSDAQVAWLEANRTMIISDYHSAFVVAFPDADVTAGHLHALRKRKGWKVGRAPGRFTGRHRKYSPAEIAWLRDNCTLKIKDYHATFCALFERTDVTEHQVYALRKVKKWKTGRDGRFNKGAVPWSKGKKIGNNAGSARTQFGKGNLPHNARGPGHESIGDDGYVWIVTDRRNPWTGASTWRVHKHRWVWELAHGPIAEGMALKCKGDKLNTDPSNWELVPLGVLPRLNGKSGRNYDHAPDELKPTIMAVAKLEHRLREKR